MDSEFKKPIKSTTKIKNKQLPIYNRVTKKTRYVDEKGFYVFISELLDGIFEKYEIVVSFEERDDLINNFIKVFLDHNIYVDKIDTVGVGMNLWYFCEGIKYYRELM